jgi:hypothetical protein
MEFITKILRERLECVRRTAPLVDELLEQLLALFERSPELFAPRDTTAA